MGLSRHHPNTRLCAHSHNWIVRWLESNGWKKTRLWVPPRKQVLTGDPDSGWQEMSFESKPDGWSVASLKVPGSRTPELRLSLYEWAAFRVQLDAAYNLLGVSIPVMHNRLRRS